MDFTALVQGLYDNKQITQEGVEALIAWAIIPPARTSVYDRTLGQIAYEASTADFCMKHPNAVQPIPWYRLDGRTAACWDCVAYQVRRGVLDGRPLDIGGHLACAHQ